MAKAEFFKWALDNGYTVADLKVPSKRREVQEAYRTRNQNPTRRNRPRTLQTVTIFRAATMEHVETFVDAGTASHARGVAGAWLLENDHTPGDYLIQVAPLESGERFDLLADPE